MSYAYLFKYIIIGDTGKYSTNNYSRPKLEINPKNKQPCYCVSHTCWFWHKNVFCKD